MAGRCLGIQTARAVPKRQAEMRKGPWGRPGHRVLAWSPCHLVSSPFFGAGGRTHTSRMPLPSRLSLARAGLGGRDPEETASELGEGTGEEGTRSVAVRIFAQPEGKRRHHLGASRPPREPRTDSGALPRLSWNEGGGCGAGAPATPAPTAR